MSSTTNKRPGFLGHSRLPEPYGQDQERWHPLACLGVWFVVGLLCWTGVILLGKYIVRLWMHP